MSKRIVAVIGSLVAALAGGWLILAPFAFGYRKAGAAWNHPTEVDFWTGAGVVAVALVALVASAAGVRAELRLRGALPPRVSLADRRAQKAAARAAAAPAPPGPAEAAALGPAEAAPPGPEPAPAPTPADLRDLLAPLVQALLVDLNDHDQSAAASDNATPGNHSAPSGPSVTGRPATEQTAPGQPTRRSYT